MTETQRILILKLLDGHSNATDEQLRLGIIAISEWQPELYSAQRRRETKRIADDPQPTQWQREDTQPWDGNHGRSTRVRRAAGGGPADP